jgi:lysophospholipase L1-like esterase
VALIAAACGSSQGSNQPEGTTGAPAPSSTVVVTTVASPTSTGPASLNLVAIGDSIPYNSSNDCSGCTGFVDQYADAVEAATGNKVLVTNLSEHNGLTLPQLLEQLDGFSSKLAAADIILVGIAHNSAELSSDTPCGAPVDTNQMPDWSKVDMGCAVAGADTYRPQYESLFSRIAALRTGKPTILRTVNRYNDWIGFPSGNFTPDIDAKTKLIIDQWDQMLCAAARQSGFGCADIYAAFNGPDGLTPSGDLLGPDYTHPSQKGNDLITSVLVDMGFAPLA